jgi:tRNA (guanine-N7-)-methyltransferase
MSDSQPKQHRGIKSYVLRQGRLTPGQQHALEKLWPLYGLEAGEGRLDLEQLFGRSAPLVLEIGFGMGDSLVAQALENPDKDFIGVEVHKPGVGHLLMTMRDHSCENIRVFSEDSLDVLREAIPAHSLDAVQLFFPDPWPKKKHHKRRIVNAGFAALLATRLTNDGLFHFATDWEPYAEAVEEMFAGLDTWEPATPPSRPETKFERRGRKLGHRIRDLAYRVRQPAAAGH